MQRGQSRLSSNERQPKVAIAHVTRQVFEVELNKGRLQSPEGSLQNGKERNPTGERQSKPPEPKFHGPEEHRES